ncbi:molybdopterin molybdotransferase MoeA [Streptomyces sp. A7024]|uniref:Molybdopterin molybdenumtransferase n=1 Tax=Streptomyces coryli TaxID=1128680 RepID=A0A6G4TUZ6_9ACTN|nr:molybdopterin molybdotransferase MoeA [Streptomyces coryli]NGN63592.1 molybdopterin molybdotransferase MoeA [Streptomyces coryli]
MTTLDERPTARHPETHESPTPWPEARRIAAGAAQPLPARDAPLRRCRGRALAEPLVAGLALPGFDTAAMDGYAVAGPAPWRVVGRILAGREAVIDRIAAGEAAEIATGALVPAGATAVLPYEQAGRAGELVTGSVEAGRHIRRRGEECAEGREVLPAGTVVSPAALGLAASLGCDRLAVHRRPQVAVLVTGDEVVRRGTPPPGRVRDAIGPLLPGLVEWAGGEPLPTTYVPDGRTPLAEGLTRAARATDVIAACGASSRGPADHLRGTLRELGAAFLIDGVACRPGHPQLLARLPCGTLVAGLPGNPYAAYAAGLTLLAPLLGRLSGRTPPGPRYAPLSPAPGGTAPHPRDTRLVAVTLDAAGRATPVGRDRPGLLWGAAAADALAVLPPGGELPPEAELLELPQ